MKILHVVPSMHREGGGTSEVVPRLCEALSVAGHEVRIVCAETSDYADAVVHVEQKGVRVYREPIYSIPRLSCFHVTPRYWRQMRELIIWADVVHIHCLWMDSTWSACWLCRRLHRPYLVQPHGFLEPERLKKSALQKRIIGALIERPNLNRAAAVIATAESEKSGIEQFGVTVPIKVVPIGLDTAPIEAACRNEKLLERLGLDPHKKTLLYFSRLTPIKGLDFLALAWQQLKPLHRDWQLCIAGPDDRGYAAVIKAEYDRLVTDGSVAFPGPVYGDDKYTLLKSCDAFVLPTRSENFSIAVAEALAAGLPVVCTRGAPWQDIEEVRAGYWVNISVEGIKNGLMDLLSLGDETLREMGVRGVEYVRINYSWEVVAREVVDTYVQLSLCNEQSVHSSEECK